MQTLDFSQDYLCWDNVQPVRYEVGRRNAPAVDAPPAFDGKTPAPATPPSRNRKEFIPTAKRRNLTRRELVASGGALTSDDQRWLIPAALFPQGWIAKPGDVVVELETSDPESQGTRWTVLEVDRRKNRQTWALTCRDLVLAYDLSDSVTIERPEIRYDAAGVPTKSFPSDNADGTAPGVVLYKLTCRVQLIEKATEEERGIRGLAGKYEIYLPSDIDVSAEDRVRFADGQYGDITGYRNAERIDQLPVLLVTRTI